METIELKYGNTVVKLPIDGKNIQQVIESNPFSVDKSEDEIITNALLHPIGSKRLKEIVHEGETVCIVIPDSTRSWQKTYKYLYKIVDELNEGGVKDQDIVFLCAQGTHRKETREEHVKLLGESLAKRFEVHNHDCHDKENLVYLGTTSYGTPVIVNKKAVECDHVVITGAIVYHLLAGWSGGKKTILPGISSYETIMANHSLSLNKGMGSGSCPSARAGNIENNPVHLDMLEAAAFVKPSFMFNVVMGSDGNIAGAVAGDYIKAHAEGRKLVDKIDRVEVKGRADLVIASAGGYPKDINLYQGIKTIINAREAANEGGTIIMLSECSEGIGGDADIQDMILNYDTLQEKEEVLRANYSISKYVGYYFCETAEKYKLILVSSLDPDIFKNTKIIPVKTLEKAFEIAGMDNAKNLTINIMPHAANTLPNIAESM